jgi:hypothetical protein
LPEVAKGMPGGGVYNCYDARHDRRLAGWGEYCVASWLWCKQLECPQKREEVLKVLMKLWPEPTSLDGRMVLLRELCRDRDAETNIAALFRDSQADSRLRAEAGVCLLSQAEGKYHREVVTFAEQSPSKLRQHLFKQLAYPAKVPVAKSDPAVVRMGFALLLERRANRQQLFATEKQFLTTPSLFTHSTRRLLRKIVCTRPENGNLQGPTRNRTVVHCFGRYRHRRLPRKAFSTSRGSGTVLSFLGVCGWMGDATVIRAKRGHKQKTDREDAGHISQALAEA